MTTKEIALQIIEQLPDDASLEDIMYELYFRQKINRGLQQLADGQTVSQEEVERSLPEWLKSAGR